MCLCPLYNRFLLPACDARSSCHPHAPLLYCPINPGVSPRIDPIRCDSLCTVAVDTGLNQYAFDKRSRLMQVAQRPASSQAAAPWLVAVDELHGNREVGLMCAHFSGSAKRFLERDWLVTNFGCAPTAFAH